MGRSPTVTTRVKGVQLSILFSYVAAETALRYLHIRTFRTHSYDSLSILAIAIMINDFMHYI